MGSFAAFASFAATLAQKHAQKTASMGDTFWSAHKQGRHKFLSGGALCSINASRFTPGYMDCQPSTGAAPSWGSRVCGRSAIQAVVAWLGPVLGVTPIIIPSRPSHVCKCIYVRRSDACPHFHVSMQGPSWQSWRTRPWPSLWTMWRRSWLPWSSRRCSQRHHQNRTRAGPPLLTDTRCQQRSPTADSVCC